MYILMTSQGKYFGGLSRKSINHSFLQMAQRAPVAGFVQVVLYPSCMGLGNLRQDPYLLFGWFMMFLVFVARVVLRRNTPRILEKENGILLWRWIFGASSQIMSLTWSLTCAHALAIHGVTPSTLSMLISCLGTLALYSASYPIDAFNWATFTLTLIAPLLAATMIYMPGEGYFTLGMIMYSVFTASMALNLRRDEIDLLKNVEVVERLHGELKENHDLIRTMIGSIDELFIILNPDGLCRMTASERSEELLGLNPMNLHLNDILRLSGEAAQENSNWYDSLTSGKVEFQLAAGLGPSTLVLDEGTRRLSLKFHAMQDSAGKLSGVVMTGQDTTLEMLQQRELEAARERAELIVGLHDNPSVFRGLLPEFESMTGRLTLWTGGDLDELRFDLHTLKGNASLAGALTPARLVHDLEKYIRENLSASAESIRAIGAEFTKSYREWLFNEQSTFEKAGLFEDRHLRIPMRKWEFLKAKWSQSAVTRDLYARLESDLFTTEFGELFEPFANQVRFAARAAGKKARLVILRPDQELIIEPEKYREVFGPFVHLFTNAVDHGIEMPTERLVRGKPPEGLIEVKYFLKGSFIRIEVRDDGAGINVCRLRQKLKSAGLANIEHASDREIVAHIFDEGISTREQVTSLSGMGMGLGALKAGVTRAKGTVEVASTGHSGTVVVIELPLFGKFLSAA